MDLQAIKQAAATYGPAMTKFLREIVAFPGESSEEKEHVLRIEKEMKNDPQPPKKQTGRPRKNTR